MRSTWNLLERSAGPALAAAHAAGLGVIVKEALANGRLTSRGAIPALQAGAARAGTAPDAFALAAVLAQPWVDVVLSGATTAEMISENLAAERVAVAPAEWGELDGLIENPGAYWERRGALGWN